MNADDEVMSSFADTIPPTHKSHSMPTRSRCENGERKKAFLSLPGEIRNQIYEWVFRNEILTVGWHPRRFYKDASKAPTYLLLLCRQIYAEANGLPFALSTFHIPERTCLNTWMRHRSSVQCDAISSIQISYSLQQNEIHNDYLSEDRISFFERKIAELQKLKGLKVVTVAIYQHLVIKPLTVSRKEKVAQVVKDQFQLRLKDVKIVVKFCYISSSII